MARFAPLKAVGAVDLVGQVVEESGSHVKIQFPNSFANREAVQKIDGGSLSSITGALSLARTGEGAGKAVLDMSVGVYVPHHGVVTFNSRHESDDKLTLK